MPRSRALCTAGRSRHMAWDSTIRCCSRFSNKRAKLLPLQKWSMVCATSLNSCQRGKLPRAPSLPRVGKTCSSRLVQPSPMHECTQLTGRLHLLVHSWIMIRVRRLFHNRPINLKCRTWLHQILMYHKILKTRFTKQTKRSSFGNKMLSLWPDVWVHPPLQLTSMELALLALSPQ